MSEVINIGLDDGHSSIKVFLGLNVTDEPIQIQMLSRAKIGENRNLNLINNNNDDTTIVIETESGVEKFWVSENHQRDIIDTRSKDYPYSNLNLALVNQALRKVRTFFNGSNQLKIVAGLPANQFYDKNIGHINHELVQKKVDSLKRLAKSYAESEEDLPRLEAVAVKIIPEGYGILTDLMYDNDLQETEFSESVSEYGCVVIDIGGRTVDVVSISSGNKEPIGMLSFDKGVLYLREKIKSKLTERLNLTQSPNDNLLDKAIETNWYGKQGSKSGVEVSQILSEAYDEHVREIYSDIKDILGSNEAFGGVIISGGGAILLGEKMKDIVEEHHPNIDVYVPNESQFSNARGFWKLTYLLDF